MHASEGYFPFGTTHGRSLQNALASRVRSQEDLPFARLDVVFYLTVTIQQSL